MIFLGIDTEQTFDQMETFLTRSMRKLTRNIWEALSLIKTGQTMALPISFFTAGTIAMVAWLYILSKAVITIGSWCWAKRKAPRLPKFYRPRRLSFPKARS